MLLLEGKEVTRYFGGLAAISDVDFLVQQGEVLGLIGPNGAGKTTLFNLISAVLTPTSGAITFKGKDITGVKPYKVCRMGVARTFQTVKTFANMPVLQNVLLGSYFGTSGTISSTDALGEATDLLEFVGLSAVKSHPV
jgi:branched-chain amino acid transport system ATP-binding protein